MAPFSFPHIPIKLRGCGAVSNMGSDDRKKAIEQYLTKLGEYQQQTSKCVEYSTPKRCDCDFTALLSNEHTLCRLVEISESIMVMKYCKPMSYYSFCFHQRQASLYLDFDPMIGRRYLVPQVPQAPDDTGLDSYRICYGSWLKLMQITSREQFNESFFSASAHYQDLIETAAQSDTMFETLAQIDDEDEKILQCFEKKWVEDYGLFTWPPSCGRFEEN